MSKYRNQLPQLSSDQIFLTDGGLETTLIFEKGYDLPEFAAFDLFKHEGGYQTIKDYYLPYIHLARDRGNNFILESATWRASRGWGAKLGYSRKDLKEVNTVAISLLKDLRDRFETPESKFVISGCIGPRGDGYQVGDAMRTTEAEQYHWEQINTFRQTAVDMVSAFTMNYVEEAVGITRAAALADLPVVIGFTVETDGRLPSGQPLGEAINAVDQATGNGPAYYMINCAHTSHFKSLFATDQPWTKRIQSLRANASAKSHAELDEATELDAGDPIELGNHYAQLKCQVPQLNVFGGCCGTSHDHMAEIIKAIKPQHDAGSTDACAHLVHADHGASHVHAPLAGLVG